MANYIEEFNSKLDWAMPFQRTGKFPLDRSGFFDSYTDAVAYAKGDGSDSRGLGGTSHIGQLIVVFENDIVTVYKINANRTIEALTSASGVDADILDIQTKLNEEIQNRINAINALDATILGEGSNVNVTVTQTDGVLTKVEVTDVILSDSYTKVEYPTISDENVIFIPADVNDTLDVAVNKLDQNISTLVQEVLNNEEVIAAALTKHNDSAGFDENANYVVDNSAEYINVATTLSEADSLLDNAIVNEVNERTTAINALTTNLNSEISRAKAAEKVNADAIAAETSARTSADNTLTTNLNNEISARTNADTALSNRITTLETAVGEGGSVETQINDAIAELDSNYSQSIAVDSNGKVTNFHIGFKLEQQDGKIVSFEIDEADIASAYDLNQEIENRTEAISNLKITAVTGSELSSLGTNVREAYKLIDGNSTQHGNYIKIYKDTSLKSVSFSDQKLHFTYILTDGSEDVVDVDVSAFLTENEYGDGLQVIDHVISLKKDTTSESFLSVSENGVKLSGVQTAINNAVAAETNARTSADNTLTSNLNNEISARTNADTALSNRITTLETAVGEGGSVETQINDAIAKLDYTPTVSIGSYVNGVSQTDGVISTTTVELPSTSIEVNVTGVSQSGTPNIKYDRHLSYSLNQEYGKIVSFEIDEYDIASALDLADEMNNRASADNTLTTNLNNEISRAKAAEKVNADAIAAETSARTSADNTLTTNLNNEISARTNADTALSNRITSLENKVGNSNVSTQITNSINALSGTTSGDGTHVDITIVQKAGKISSVTISENDIASASALSTETINRTNSDNKIISAVGLNTDGTFKKPTTAQTSGYTTAATSILDAIIILDNQVEENETVAAYALTDLNDRLATTNTALNSLTEYCSYMSGHTTTTSLTTVPTTKRMCIATISTSQTLGLNGSITDGREVHIFVKNSSSSDITITIPSTIGGKTIVNMLGENLTIYGNSYAEINLASDGTNIYYRGV